MANDRRRDTQERLGLDSQREREEQQKAIEKERLRREHDELVRQSIEASFSYRVLIKGAIGFDIADAILGWLEEFGDLFSFVLGLGYVYVSATVVRHFRLTLAVLFVVLIDFLVGCIPVAGSIVDMFFPANYICRNMIEGVVNHDKKQKRVVNFISLTGIFFVGMLGFLVYKLVGAIFSLWG